MTPGAGSPADVPCPQCRSTQAIVALNVPTAIFYRCSHCKHVWSVPTSSSDSGVYGGTRLPSGPVTLYPLRS